tara:strand:- start:2201 stop:3388 length:1188 start_codon:yes stop_codon:yes gene_type:complete
MIKKKNLLIYSEKVEEEYLVIDEVCKNLVFVDENIKRVRFDKKNKKFIIYLSKNFLNYKKKIISNKIKKFLIKSYSKYKIPKSEVLFNKLKNKNIYDKNPMKSLIKNKVIFKEEEGVYSFGDKLTKLINIFDRKIIEVAKKMNAKNFHFPSLMSGKMLNQIDYLKNNPHNLGFVTHLKEDINKIDNFKKKIATKKTINFDKNNFSESKVILSPTVCQHLYHYLSNSKLKNNITATATGHCFRYESKNMHFVDRLWNFTMREIIFVGSKEYVSKSLVKSMKLLNKVLDQFGLSYIIQSASDPFFGDMSGDKSLFQKTFKLKYEVRSAIPYNNSTISIGSYNNSQDFFAKKLKISNKKGKHVYSGCVGFGNERFAYSFICQYGIDEKKWPKNIAKLL